MSLTGATDMCDCYISDDDSVQPLGQVQGSVPAAGAEGEQPRRLPHSSPGHSGTLSLRLQGNTAPQQVGDGNLAL